MSAAAVKDVPSLWMGTSSGEAVVIPAQKYCRNHHHNCGHDHKTNNVTDTEINNTDLSSSHDCHHVGKNDKHQKQPHHNHDLNVSTHIQESSPGLKETKSAVSQICFAS